MNNGTTKLTVVMVIKRERDRSRRVGGDTCTQRVLGGTRLSLFIKIYSWGDG